MVEDTKPPAESSEASRLDPPVDPKPAADPKPTRRGRKPAQPAAVVARAGGYVDHGDGNGWVIEEQED